MDSKRNSPAKNRGTINTIALGKGWKRRRRDEPGKLLIGIQRVKAPSGQGLASRPVASVAIHRVTGGCEAYTARKQATTIQLRKLSIVAMPTPLVWRKAIPGRPITQGRPGVAGVPSSGHASKGIPQEPRRAPHLLLTMGGTGRQGKPEATGTDGRAVLRTHSTCEGGEPQGSREGRPRNPLEGRGEQADASGE